MSTHDVVLAAITSGASKGHVETIVGIVGLVVTALLLVIGVVIAVTRRRGALPWFGLGVIALFGTVGVLSYV